MPTQFWKWNFNEQNLTRNNMKEKNQLIYEYAITYITF